MICEACNENVHPVQEMKANGRGFQTKCPRLECGAPMPEIARIEVMAPREEPRTEQIASLDAATLPAPIRERLLTSSREADNDILAMSRARLAQVELRLSEHDKLLGEARRLRAMIAAAEATESN